MYAKFNDPDADIDALVLNMAVSAAGLNLQGACTEGIILMEGWNRPLTFQAFGRIWRIGNKWLVTFVMLRVPGTYYDVLEDKANRKYAEQLRNECIMPKHFSSVLLQRLFAYELISQYFGLPFNRFIWVLLPPNHIRDYNIKGMKRAGQFLTMVLFKLLRMHPEGGFRDDCEESQAAIQAASEVEKYIVKAAMYFAENPHVEINLDADNAIKKYAELGQDYGHAKAAF